MSGRNVLASRSPSCGTVGETVILQWIEQVTQMYMVNDFKVLSTGVHFTGVLENLYSELTYTVNRENSTLETLSERFAFIRENLAVTYGDYVESIINISACRLGDTDALMNVSLLLLCSLTNAIIHRRKQCEHFLPGLYRLRPVVQERIKSCVEEWLRSDNDKMGTALARMKNVLRMEFEAPAPSPREKKRKSIKLPPLQVYFDSEEIKQELILRENRHLQLVNAEKPTAIIREIPAAAVCEPSSSGSERVLNFCSTEETGKSFIMTFPTTKRQLQMPELEPTKVEMPALICESSPFGSKRKRSSSVQGPEEVHSSEKDSRINELEQLLKNHELLLKQKEQVIGKLNVEKQNLQSRGNLFQLKYEEISKSQEDKSARDLSLEKELQETKSALEKYKQVSPKKLPGNKFHAAEIKKLKQAHGNELSNATRESESKIKAVELKIKTVEMEKECLRKELEKVTEIYGSSLKSVEDFNEQERRLALQSQVYEEKLTKLMNKLQSYEEKFGPLESSGNEEKQMTEDLPRTDKSFQLKNEECDPVLKSSSETAAKIEEVERVNRECNLRIAKYEEEKGLCDILISEYQEKITSCQTEYEDKLKENQEQIVKYEEKRKSSDVLITEQKEKIEDFEKQITEMKNKCEDFENKILDYEKRIEISDKKVEECISAAELEKKKHDEMIKNLKAELAQAKVNIKDFEDKVADCEEKIKISNEKNMECNSAAESAKQKHEEEIKNFEALLAETKKDSKHFEQLVTEGEVKIKILNSKVEDYQRVISQLNSQIAQYKKRVTESELQHTKDSEKLLKLPQLEEKIEELNNQNKVLFQQAKDHQASDTKAAVVLKELKDNHKTEVAGLSNRISQLEMEINNKNASLLQEGKKYKECKDELEYTGKLLTEAKKEKIQREQELAAIRQARVKENDERSLELTLLIEKSDTLKKTLQEKIENLTNENEVFRKQMEIKNAQMEEKEALQLEKEGALKKIEELQCTYTQDVHKLNVEIENLQNELSDTKFSLQEQLKIHNSEKSEIEKKKEDLLIDIKKIREDSNMEIEMLQRKLSDSLEEQLRIHTCEKTKLNKENEHLLKKIKDDSNTQIEKLQGELSEKNRLYEELKNTASPERVAELQSKHSLLAKKHRRVKIIAVKRGNMIKKYCELSNQSKKELVDYKKRVAATINRKVASDVQDKTSALRKEVAALQEKLCSRDEDVKSLKANVESVTKDFECKMERMKSEHEEQVNFVKHERSMLKREVKDLKCSINEEKQEFIMSLRQTIYDLKNRLFSNEEERINTQKKHEAERQEDFTRNENLREEITKVKDELTFYKEHNDLAGLKKLQDKINKQEVEKGKLKFQIQHKQKIIDDLRLDNTHFQNQVELLTDLKDRLDDELIITREKYAALSSTTDPGSEEQKKESEQKQEPKRRLVSLAGPSGKSDPSITKSPSPSVAKSVHSQSHKQFSLDCHYRKKHALALRKRQLKQQTKLLQKKFKVPDPKYLDFLVEMAMEVETTPEIKKHFYFPVK